MSNNHLVGENAGFFENMVFDRHMLGEEADELFGKFLRQTIDRYSHITAAAALCVPEGQTAYHQAKNFTFIIFRQGNENFLVTIRNRQAALSFEANIETYEEEKLLRPQATRGFLGTIRDINSLLRSTTLSLGNMHPTRDFSKQLVISDDKSSDTPFLNLAGHEDSPERKHLNEKRKTGKILEAHFT